MKIKTWMTTLAAIFILTACQETKSPVDYVNPYMGNMSHMLVPTYPTVHLPNSMLRIRPERDNHTSDYMYGLQLLMPSHRSGSLFRLSPVQKSEGEPISGIETYTWDNEKLTPYRHQVYLDNQQIGVDFAPSHQSAIYEISFQGNNPAENILVFHSGRGTLQIEGNTISGFQRMGGETTAYIYMETDVKPEKVGYLEKGKLVVSENGQVDPHGNVAMTFGTNDGKVAIRYGISYIDVEQAKKNLAREITDFNVERVANEGRKIWNETLGKIKVEGSSENNKTIFYTSLYRTYERMINISEDGRYFSGSDKQVHNDEGVPFFTDDWIWDTYRAVHPLRTIIEPTMEGQMIASYVRMAQQSGKNWLPTFPEVNGDSHRMNGNHGIAVIADAVAKNIGGFDLNAAYEAGKNSVMTETHAPWSRREAGEYDQHYKDHGYFPGLKIGEQETLPEINGGERRQSVAVTLAAAYDDWCLSQIAKKLNKKEDADFFGKRAFNYRNLYNSETGFFHPKDAEGNFIEPFDYKFSGGMGARDYYDENNGWTYRWDVPHNIPDLIALMGGNEAFCRNLDRLFNEDLGKIKWDFWAQLPDQTGNVGQFSMGNEPSLHIPYLYNYAGQPWKTQKRIRRLIEQWFRNDLMGVPGDEDGGGMSAFVVFSAMGFYPVTPGTNLYTIGSPMFEKTVITLENGKTFTIKAPNCSYNNKYIQSATLNGKPFNSLMISHQDIVNGGELVLVMGDKANPQWGTDEIK